MTPDGERFLIITSGAGADAPSADHIIVVQNWHEELKRLVPVD